MYSSFALAKKYARYFFTAANGRGHGIHSPFVFDFIKFVLNDRKQYPCYEKIENLRRKMLHDARMVNVEDYGAGSKIIRTKQRSVRAIARYSLKPKKYAQLLFRLAAYYGAENILELGTSLGVTTAYLAAAAGEPKVTSLEGSPEIARLAMENLSNLGLSARVITGEFDESLPRCLSADAAPGLVFIDGNHRRAPTEKYFRELLRTATDQTIMVFDDIHWSAEMESAWDEIRAAPEVTLSIDLFFIGIIFFRRDFIAKQHFIIRF